MFKSPEDTRHYNSTKLLVLLSLRADLLCILQYETPCTLAIKNVWSRWPVYEVNDILLPKYLLPWYIHSTYYMKKAQVPCNKRVSYQSGVLNYLIHLRLKRSSYELKLNVMNVSWKCLCHSIYIRTVSSQLSYAGVYIRFLSG